MRLSACIIFGWLALLTAGPIYAANAPNMVQGVDASPLLDFLNTQIMTTTVPFEMFHYVDGAKHLPGKFSADDPRGYAYIKYNATQWVQHMGQTALSVFGMGLYLASDPIVSHAWGDSATWTLLEVEIPVGMRVIQTGIGASENVNLPDSAVEVLTKFGCPSSLTMQYLLSWQYYNDAPQCVRAMREVIEILKLDAFSYQFGGGYFKVCEQRSPHAEHGRAFVILSDRWLKPGTVRIFNAQTTDAHDERLRIESSFLKSATEYSQRFPDGGDMATYYLYLISPANYTAPYPTIINRDRLPYYTQVSTSGDVVFWPDLQGAMTDPKLDEWIEANWLGCSDKPQYRMDDESASGSGGQ